jgi:hypothetical protein
MKGDLFEELTLFENLMETGLPLRGTYFAGTTLIVAAVVSAVAAIGSGVASYISGQSQAAAANQQADYARSMAARNQALSEQAAQAAEAKGRYESGLQMERARKLLGKQIALAGGSGIDLTGSLLEPIKQSYGEEARDAAMIRYNAAYDAWKYRSSGETSLIEGTNQASRYDQQASTDIAQGTTSLALSPLVAGSSILTAYGKSQLPYRGW